MKRSLPTPTDFSFLETMNAHGWGALLPFSWNSEAGMLERIEQLTSGRIVCLQLSQEGTEALDIHVSEASENAEEAEIIPRVRRMLQLDLPIGEFHAFCADRPELAHIPGRRQGRMLRSPTLWEDTVKVILTTNTTWRQTKSMTARLVEGFGAAWPSEPSRHAFPSPQQIAAVPEAEFAATAKLGYRASAVHSLATAICEGILDLESLPEREPDTEALRKRLLTLRGIGAYSAACLLLYLGRPEQVNVDSWARMSLSKELGYPVTDAEVHAFFKSYGSWRGLVYTFYPWKE